MTDVKKPIARWVKPERLESQWLLFVKKTPGCWEWRGPLVSQYGDFRVNGFTFAHEYGLAKALNAQREQPYQILIKPEIPAGKCIVHTCGNPSCVRPEHLVLGSPEDNAATELERGKRHAVERDKATDMVPVRRTLEKLLDERVTLPSPRPAQRTHE